MALCFLPTRDWLGMWQRLCYILLHHFLCVWGDSYAPHWWLVVL
uniref:Uncharacterized protein n=1 Tax=Anguilla anguilla TaxID=7936 RepID=A0A0E9VAU3_ANGAN